MALIDPFDPAPPLGQRRTVGSDADASQVMTETFFRALKGLGAADVSVVHLAMTRAAALTAAGKSDEADALLLGLLRLVQDSPEPCEVASPKQPPRI